MTLKDRSRAAPQAKLRTMNKTIFTSPMPSAMSRCFALSARQPGAQAIGARRLLSSAICRGRDHEACRAASQDQGCDLAIGIKDGHLSMRIRLSFALVGRGDENRAKRKRPIRCCTGIWIGHDDSGPRSVLRSGHVIQEEKVADDRLHISTHKVSWYPQAMG